MRSRIGQLPILALVMAACGTIPDPSTTLSAPVMPSEVTTPNPTATLDPWAHLFRPLELPSIEPDEECPATSGTATLDRIGPVLGEGPIYPAFLGAEGVFSLGLDESGNEPTRFEGRDWWGKKTLWLSDDTYDGIALVRGGRIDQEADLLFWTVGGGFEAALRLTVEGWVRGGSPPGWREWNTGVFFIDPGCYAFQIDGEQFSHLIIVGATR